MATTEKDRETATEGECFIRFKAPIDAYQLPEQFNYPFNYTPHPLSRLAAEELQEHLKTQKVWTHDFGIDHPVEGTNIGKMFGVMVVRNPQNEIGYLAAFSGKLAGKNNLPHFAPPIVDLLCEDGFYRRGEEELNAINRRIKELEQSPDLLHYKETLKRETSESQNELEQYRKAMKVAKQGRDAQRSEAETRLTPEEFEALKETLKNESLKWQYDYKQLVKQWAEKLENCQAQLETYTNESNALKEERKTKSAALQQQMFDLYGFLNSRGEIKNVREIFDHTEQKTPPAGAGDCSAPKLLQYAWQHNLQPLCMAEFWWGQSPKSEIRKHGNFYPSCNSKCKPILGHMLEGVDVTINPLLLQPHNRTIEKVFEDDDILIINKPAEFLSVPGTTDAESVYSYVRREYPDATGPLMVHRLDMSTSGLMVIAKTETAYHNLQDQFLNKTVKKRYTALLDGIIKEDEGIINLPLRVDLDDRPRQLVCYDYGKPSITRWKVTNRSHNRTRVQFYPITGRTHQLRVHSAHHQGLNCPIAGDDLYGQRADRLHLHAEYLEFIHPRTNKSVKFMVEAEF